MSEGVKEQIKAFYEIGRSLSTEKDTMKLLEMIITSSIYLTSSDAGTIYLVLDKASSKLSGIRDGHFQDKLLKFSIARNMSIDTHLEDFTQEINEKSIVGNCAITGNSVHIADAYHIHPDMPYRHNNSFDMNTGYVTKSLLSIPMKDRENHVIGVIQLINKKKEKNKVINYSLANAIDEILPFDDADELIMNSLAGQAAVALENNILYQDMKELLQVYKHQNEELTVLSTKILKAHEEERKRIARDIHDGPAQSTASLAMKLEILKKYLEHNELDKLALEIEKMSVNVRATVKEIRTIIYDLKPTHLEDGLIQALKGHLSVFSENTGVRIVFQVNGEDSRIEYYLTSTLYRIVQEALTNAQKHAHAHSVQVQLDIEEHHLQLEIEDDGVGFDLTKLTNEAQNKLEGGFGLEGIRERVELMHGKLEIQSAPGKGTNIIIRIPLA